MTLNGFGNQRLALNKRKAELAKAFPNGVRCQKCLEYGHWSYECNGKRKYVHRTSRTKRLNQNIDQKINSDNINEGGGSNNEPKPKKLRKIYDSSSSSSGSSSDSSSDSSSATDSSSSDSESSSPSASSPSSSESDSD